MRRFNKSGQLGGFQVEIEDGGIVRASLHPDGALREFPNAQAAVELYAPMAQGNHSAWNICYALEDFLCPTEEHRHE